MLLVLASVCWGFGRGLGRFGTGMAFAPVASGLFPLLVGCGGGGALGPAVGCFPLFFLVGCVLRGVVGVAVSA